MKVLFILITIITFVGCKKSSESTNEAPVYEERFPEVYLEAGEDTNYTYISLIAERLLDGTMNLEATGWGIEECGISLNRSLSYNVLNLSFGWRCNTLTDTTWVKKTFKYLLVKSEEATLKKIRFSNLKYSVEFEKEKMLVP